MKGEEGMVLTDGLQDLIVEAKTKIEYNYQSPRWTQELLDCSMPMTLDTYSVCSYNCQYCFAFFQKVHNIKGMREHTHKVRAVNVNDIKDMFTIALNGGPNTVGAYNQFFPYIKARKVMQWGALADPFDNYEKRFGVTLELLKFFHSIDYPLSFSTKAAWFGYDKRYTDLFKQHAHNWHFKVSIITMDEAKSKAIEKGCPTPLDRMGVIRELTRLGIHVTLRLRPYMIGASEDYRETIKAAHDAGADSVSTEYFCLESRADEVVKERYTAMSRVLGYDLLSFYKANSKQPGYKRLSRELKRPVFDDMRVLCHELGMRFHVSDAFCREMNDGVNCCGVPPDWNSQTSHFGGAILKAKAKGQVRFSDIREEIHRFFNWSFHKGSGYNDSSNQLRAKFNYATMADWFRFNWNQPQSWRGPGKSYGDILKPVGRDGNGDIIYEYNDH